MERLTEHALDLLREASACFPDSLAALEGAKVIADPRARAATLELLFPMKDEESARLMIVKADCLMRAGVISESECESVVLRAFDIFGLCSFRQAA